MEKNIQKIKIKNQLELWAFCAVIGTVAGALVWALLKIMAIGTEMIWEWIPEKIHIPYYTVLVCTVGGAIIGIFRKLYGDYPEDMETVMGKVKKEKRYEYKNMLVMMIAALLPLLIGSSVGPEAGLTGIIVGLCYWAGENLKFAKQNTKEYSQIGAAVSLSVLFHAPLFGIFEVEEDPDMQMAELGKGSKIFIYGIALAAGTGSYAGLSALLGGGMSGFPSFDAVAVQRIDYVMMLVYMFCGCVRYVDTGSDVFGRRADGSTYERICRLYGNRIDRCGISESITYKSLYPVWIKRRTFFPGYFCGSVSGIRTCDAVLRTAGGQSCCICCSNCNIDTSGRYYEEAAGGDHAFVPVFSCENIYMDIYCGSSGK